jgi:hypothetical protein
MSGRSRKRFVIDFQRLPPTFNERGRKITANTHVHAEIGINPRCRKTARARSETDRAQTAEETPPV